MRELSKTLTWLARAGGVRFAGSLAAAWALCVGATSLAAAADTWLEPPQLAVMTGFIKDPQQPGTLEDWQRDLGREFSAAAWVRSFRSFGASYLIFYDKWIDGLVFHDTATTGFKTDRDFLREIADECRNRTLPLVIYWNAAYDHNPEFAEYVMRDAAGNPVSFPEPWPCRQLSMHSPFRGKAQQQVREILTDYGPIAGLWLDVYSQSMPSTDPYTVAAFGKARDAAAAVGETLGWGQFSLATLTAYLDDLRGLANELEPGLHLTINGSAQVSAHWAEGASKLGFYSVEGHSFHNMEIQSYAASFLRRPMETGNLISSWWSPPGTPVPAGRARRAVAECAVAWCQGANVYLALCPEYDGTFAEEQLAPARAAGAWLARRRPLLVRSQPHSVVGIVMDAPLPEAGHAPPLARLWGMPTPSDAGSWGQAQSLHRALIGAGYPSEILFELAGAAAWPADLSRFPALVLCERARLGSEHLTRLRRYVRAGGRLIALGNASRLAANGANRDATALADVLGVVAAKPYAFPPESAPAQCYADSAYGRGYVTPNLADGTSAAWASSDTPMPHWAQVNLPLEQPVAKVRVTARAGGYILRDFEVMTWTGADWDTLAMFSDNGERTVECLAQPPRTTLGVRVHVTRATYQGDDRQLADIEEIQLFDADGELLSRAGADAYKLSAAARAPAVAACVDGASLRGPVLVGDLAPSVETVATYAAGEDAVARPLLTRHPFGEGTAWWAAVGEGSLAASPGWVRGVLTAVLGKAPLTWSDVSRFRVFARRQRETMVLCAVDSQPLAEAAELQVRLNPAALGLEGVVVPGVDSGGVSTERDADTLTVTCRPDPALTVVIR